MVGLRCAKSYIFNIMLCSGIIWVGDIGKGEKGVWGVGRVFPLLMFHGAHFDNIPLVDVIYLMVIHIQMMNGWELFEGGYGEKDKF